MEGEEKWAQEIINRYKKEFGEADFNLWSEFGWWLKEIRMQRGRVMKETLTIIDNHFENLVKLPDPRATKEALKKKMINKEP